MKWVSIIVNYRSAGLTLDCLRSLEPEVRRFAADPDGGPIHIVVTDNHSPDDSVAVLRSAIEANGWTDWVTLLPLPENGGFSYGNNRGIEHALAMDPPPEVVHLLNPDTLVREGALLELARFMAAHPDVGIAGSRLEDPDGTAQHSGFRFHSVPGEFAEATRVGVVLKLLGPWRVAAPILEADGRVDWVAGASMAVRRAVIDHVGLLDERYFMYYEEMDFTLTARRAGWPCGYTPASRVVHLVGQVSGVTKAKRDDAPGATGDGSSQGGAAEPSGASSERGSRGLKRRPRYWYEARAYFWKKNHGALTKFAADVAFVLGILVHRCSALLKGKPHLDPPGLLADFIRFNALGTWKD